MTRKIKLAASVLLLLISWLLPAQAQDSSFFYQVPQGDTIETVGKAISSDFQKQGKIKHNFHYRIKGVKIYSSVDTTLIFTDGTESIYKGKVEVDKVLTIIWQVMLTLFLAMIIFIIYHIVVYINLKKPENNLAFSFCSKKIYYSK